MVGLGFRAAFFPKNKPFILDKNLIFEKLIFLVEPTTNLPQSLPRCSNLSFSQKTAVTTPDFIFQRDTGILSINDTYFTLCLHLMNLLLDIMLHIFNKKSRKKL